MNLLNFENVSQPGSAVGSRFHSLFYIFAPTCSLLVPFYNYQLVSPGIMCAFVSVTSTVAYCPSPRLQSMKEIKKAILELGQRLTAEF